MKKKFTMLFAALLAFVGVAKAEFVETSTDAAPKYYVIASYSRGGFLTNAGVDAGLTHVALSDAGYWYFEKANEDGGVYIVNKTLSGEDKVYVGSDCKASTTAAVWYVKENGVNKKGLSISKTATISNYSCIDANNNNDGVGTWQPSASDWEGTTWVLASITDLTYNPNNLIFRTRSDRYVTSVALNGGFNNSAEVNHDYKGANGLVYNDLTETVTMRAVAGETVTASLARNGAWTNAYVYIDYDNDGFTADIDEDGFTPAGDLVSYSFYSGDEADDTSGKNSAGEDLTGPSRNTLTLPAFTAPSTPGTYRLRFKNDWNSINPNGGNANFNSNGGSFIDVTLEVVSSTIDVQYSYQYNGVEKYTQTSKAVVGDEYPAVTANFPFGITATKPTGNIAEGDVVDGVVTKIIALEENLPFTYAADYASIENWYYLIFHANTRNYLYSDGTENVLDATKTSVDAANKDAYSWAFVGNPFDGFKVVNKAAGEEKQLNTAASGAVLGTADQTFKLTTSSHGTNGFFMQATTGDYKDRFNKQGGKVVYWDGADAGSTFMVELRDDAAQLAAFVASANELLTNLGEGTTVGCVTADSKAAINAAIAEANTAIETKTGIDAAQAALNAAIAAVETIQPEAGKFYTIQNTYSNVYMNVNNGGTMAVSNEASISEVFLFVSAGEGKFYLKNVERGTFLNNAPVHGGGHVLASAATEGAAKAVTIANLGVENRVSITPEGGATIHHDAGQGVIVGWNGDAGSRSAWKIVEVDVATLGHAVAVTEAGWATLTLGYNATIPAGVTAYAVSEIDGQYAKLAEVTGVIPAGEAVLLNAEAGTYEFKYAESAEPVASNLLEGTVFNTNVTANAYVLAAKEDVVGLYKAKLNVVDLDKEVDADGDGDATNDYTAFLNNAFKAYLPVAGASAPMFSLERGEGTTGIETAVSGEQTVVIYDLAGRRVEKMEKGIYIVNGKKVVIK